MVIVSSGLEFAYSAAPRTFQGMIMGLFYTLEGVGSLLGTALLHLVSPFWLANTTDYGNINDNHLDFYLYFLGVLQFTTFLAYCGSLYMQRFSLRPIAMPQRRVRTRRRVPRQGLLREEEEEEAEEEPDEEGDGDDEEEEEDSRATARHHLVL